MTIGTQAAPNGRIHLIHQRAMPRYPSDLVEDPVHGHYRRSRRGLLLHTQPQGPPLQQQLLAWLRDHVDHRIPRHWYQLVLGHDLHLSVYASLYLQHHHATERDPFTGAIGWTENLGRVSQGKVTTAFRDFEVDQLIAESSLYGDFRWHEVGTGVTAEANTQTALVTPSGVARQSGTQVESAADTYQSVATITAAGSQTWAEHGIFNAVTTGTLMDRSLVSPTVSVVASDTVTFTYSLVKSAES